MNQSLNRTMKEIKERKKIERKKEKQKQWKKKNNECTKNIPTDP